MPSTRSSRKKQTRLAFSPLASSSPQAASYPSHIQEKAAAIRYNGLSSPTKKRRLDFSKNQVLSSPSKPISNDVAKGKMYTRKTSHGEDGSTVEEQGLGLPTPEPSSQPLLSGDPNHGSEESLSSLHEVENEDEDDIPHPNLRQRVRTNRVVSISSDDEFEDVIELSKPQIGGKISNSRRGSATRSRESRQPVSPHSYARQFLLGGSTGNAPIQRSHGRKLVTPTKATRRRNSPRRLRSSTYATIPVVRPPASSRVTRQSVRPEDEFELASDDSELEYIKEEDSIITKSPQAPVKNVNSDDDSDIVLPSPRRLRNKSQSSDPPTNDHDTEDSDEIVVSSAKKKRLVRPAKSLGSPKNHRSVEDDDDLEEDLEALQSTEVRKERTRGKVVNSKQVEARKQLEKLKAKREGKKTVELSSDSEAPLAPKRNYIGNGFESEADILSENSEVEESNEAVRQSLLNDEDEYEADFVDDEEDGLLGEPPAGYEEMPLEFTRHAHKRAKEHFKDVVEWMVHKKLNPAFPRDDPVYRIAFYKLDDEVKGYSGSKFLSSAWTGDFARAIKARPHLLEVAVPTMFDHKCDACNRSGHPAKFRITFSGKAYNLDTLENLSDDEDDDNDDASDDRKSLDRNGHPLPSVDKPYFIGRFCKANATTAHSLLHWRWHLNDWVLDWLKNEGYTTAEKIVERERWSMKRRSEYANKVVDEMEMKGEIKDLYHDFKSNLELARSFKPPKYRG